MNQKPVCTVCGGSDISADAAARWNEETQEWEVSDVFDKGHHCDTCEGECSIQFVDVT